MQKLNNWRVKLGIAVLLVLYLSYEYANGVYRTFGVSERHGVVQQFGYEGMVFKSYEGELRYTDLTSQRSENWSFSTVDDNLAERIKLLSGKHVIVKYYKWWQKPYFLNTRYDAYDVLEDKP